MTDVTDRACRDSMTYISTHIHVHVHNIHTYTRMGFVIGRWLIELVTERKSAEAVGVAATLWNTLQHTATHCSTLQHTATHCNTRQHTAIHCNTLQYTATHCNTLQYTTTHCRTLQHTAIHCNTLQYIATHCNTLQHTATHCNTLQHTATHCHRTQQHTLKDRGSIPGGPRIMRKIYKASPLLVTTHHSHESTPISRAAVHIGKRREKGRERKSARDSSLSLCVTKKGSQKSKKRRL